MQVKELMSSPVISCDLSWKISQVAHTLTKYRIHAIPVLDKNRKIAGIVTEKDFFIKDESSIYLPSFVHFFKKSKFERCLDKKLEKKFQKILNAKAGDIMSSPALTVSPEDKIEEVIKIFQKTQYNTLPVIDENEALIGIITITDIIGIF